MSNFDVDRPEYKLYLSSLKRFKATFNKIESERIAEITRINDLTSQGRYEEAKAYCSKLVGDISADIRNASKGC